MLIINNHDYPVELRVLENTAEWWKSLQPDEEADIDPVETVSVMWEPQPMVEAPIDTAQAPPADEVPPPPPSEDNPLLDPDPTDNPPSDGE